MFKEKIDTIYMKSKEYQSYLSIKDDRKRNDILRFKVEDIKNRLSKLYVVLAIAYFVAFTMSFWWKMESKLNVAGIFIVSGVAILGSILLIMAFVSSENDKRGIMAVFALCVIIWGVFNAVYDALGHNEANPAIVMIDILILSSVLIAINIIWIYTKRSVISNFEGYPLFMNEREDKLINDKWEEILSDNAKSNEMMGIDGVINKDAKGTVVYSTLSESDINEDKFVKASASRIILDSDLGSGKKVYTQTMDEVPASKNKVDLSKE